MDKIFSFFAAVSLFISYALGLGQASASCGHTLEKTDKLGPLASVCSAQGLCCDGEYFYASGAISALGITGLAKYDLDMNTQKLKYGAIPREFSEKYGSDHIGGIDCADGMIYAPAEGKIDGEYRYNLILLFDCETLEYTGVYYDVSCERLTDGLPWLAIDRDRGILYTSVYSHANELLSYNLADMSFIGAIPLKEEVHRIQGGSVYEGVLYLSCDSANSTNERIFRVNPADGSVETETVRTLPNFDNEAEDVCFYPLEDGTLIHALDYDKLLSAVVRHYK